MKNILLVAGGFVVGGAAGAGATYFIMKRKAEDYINEELEKIEKTKEQKLKILIQILKRKKRFKMKKNR